MQSPPDVSLKGTLATNAEGLVTVCDGSFIAFAALKGEARPEMVFTQHGFRL